jgi:hypothetical protein
MTVSQATAEVFLTALRALPAEERQAILAHIVEDEEWQEDIQDLAVFSQRRNEPSRLFRDFPEKHGA